LISAWTTVDRKNKYEFRLRVAKRKEAVAGSATTTAPTTPAKAPEAPRQAAAAGQAAAPQISVGDVDTGNDAA